MKVPQADIELLQKLKTNHQPSFQKLYKDYFTMAHYFVMNNSGTLPEAKDTFQDAIIVLFEKIQVDDFILQCTLKTFIYAIVRNLWLKKLRTKKKSIKIEDFEQYVPVETDLYDKQKDEQIDLVAQNMKKLGEKCQQLLTGFYFYKKKMQVLAEELGYTNAANAKNQKYKCLQKLKVLVGAK
ncbi:MAG: RNA polymerase sigma factor [Chitinophagales bacterium]